MEAGEEEGEEEAEAFGEADAFEAPPPDPEHQTLGDSDLSGHQWTEEALKEAGAVELVSLHEGNLKILLHEGVCYGLTAKGRTIPHGILFTTNSGSVLRAEAEQAVANGIEYNLQRKDKIIYLNEVKTVGEVYARGAKGIYGKKVSAAGKIPETNTDMEGQSVNLQYHPLPPGAQTLTVLLNIPQVKPYFICEIDQASGILRPIGCAAYLTKTVRTGVPARTPFEWADCSG